MGLFFNNTTGPGVPKNAPKKKPFFRFWELFGNKFWDLFKINLIYFLFCIPIVTIGPATAAMTALMRNICIERPQFIFHDFLREFRKNFKQSFIIGIFDILIGAGFACAAILFYTAENPTQTDMIMLVVSGITALIFLVMNFYIYPQIVALDLKLSDIIRNSLALSALNIGGEIIVILVIAAYLLLVMFFPLYVLVFVPIAPLAWLGFLSVFCCYPAIQKHIINPYYEKTGEKNPELPDFDEDAIFEDRGGEEGPGELKKNQRHSKGKIIK